MLEAEVAALKQGKATAQEYGLSKISSATDVTQEDTGFVLGTIQNNPAVDGTLANRIKSLGNGLSEKNKIQTQRVDLVLGTETKKLVLDVRKDSYMFMILNFLIGASSATQQIIFPQAIYGHNWNFVSVGAQSTIYFGFSYSKVNELSAKLKEPADTSIVLSTIYYILL